MYKIERALRLLLLTSMFTAAPAGAQSAAEKIAKINENIAILTAQKAELELRAQIANKQAEIDKSGGSVAGMGGGAGSGRPASAAGLDAGLPVVRSIEGMDGKLVAMLAFPGGLVQRVQHGEKIHGDWTVADIGTHSLTLTRGREIVRLGPPN